MNYIFSFFHFWFQQNRTVNTIIYEEIHIFPLNKLLSCFYPLLQISWNVVWGFGSVAFKWSYHIKSVCRLWSLHWHSMQNFVQQLQCTMQVHFNPARSVLDGRAWIIGAPSFNEAQSKYAQSPQIIDADTSSRVETYLTSNTWIFDCNERPF